MVFPRDVDNTDCNTEDVNRSYTQWFHICKKKGGGLKTIVGVLGSLWKHQQSRDRVFLHQSCTQLFFSTPKKIIFFEVEKNQEKNRAFSKIWKKNQNFTSKFSKTQKEKIENFDFFLQIFENVRFFFRFFSTSKKIFFRSWKKSWVQFWCKKTRSLDCWCFQSDPSNPTIVLRSTSFFLEIWNTWVYDLLTSSELQHL